MRTTPLYSRRSIVAAFLLCVLIVNGFATASLYLAQRDRDIGASVLHTAESMAHVERMTQAEAGLLQDRKQQKVRAERDLQVLLATMAVACLAMVAMLFWQLERLWSMCRRAQADAEHQAHHDALTGLPNRRLLEDRLGLGLAHARRDGRMLAVLSLDLDGFGQVNDAHGSATGDEVLKRVAMRLQRASRDSDTVARLDGDEFVLVLANAGTIRGTTALAERLIDAISSPYAVDGKDVVIGASIGIAVFTGEAVSGRDLLARADAALCEAKQAGKGRFEIAASAGATESDATPDQTFV